MNDLRVLHAHSGNLFGGIESMLVTIARHATAEHRPSFALCFDGRLADELAASGAAVARLGPARLSRPWTVTRVRTALHGEMTRQPPAAVLCHSPWSSAVFGPAVRRAGVPLALWLHGPPSPASWLDRFAARRQPDVLLCNSRYTAGAARVLFPGPAHVVYPPVEAPQVDRGVVRPALRSALGALPGETVILQVSRLEPWKGHRLLLQALGLLRDTPGWTCWVAGGAQRPAETRYLEELRAAAVSLGIERRVRFLGERRDVAQLMAAADVFSQPNQEPEPFGIVFVEALYAGLPVVATDLGGAREIVTAECGVLVPPGDHAPLAQALRDLMGQATRRAALGSAGPPRARGLCHPAAQVGRLAGILEQARRIEFAPPKP